MSNSPSLEADAVLAVLRDLDEELLAAEGQAGVGHHVALSVVGTDRLSESGYFRAKIAQEKLIKESSIPYSIVHATQFFEFIKSIADAATDGMTVRLAPVLIQPMAADDVASAVARSQQARPSTEPSRWRDQSSSDSTNSSGNASTHGRIREKSSPTDGTLLRSPTGRTDTLARREAEARRGSSRRLARPESQLGSVNRNLRVSPGRYPVCRRADGHLLRVSPANGVIAEVARLGPAWWSDLRVGWNLWTGGGLERRIMSSR